MMPKRREDIARLKYTLRSAVAEYIHWCREWEMPDAEVMLQALWVITIAGVDNSGVHWSVTAKVLRVMRDIARQQITPQHALELLKGFENG